MRNPEEEHTYEHADDMGLLDWFLDDDEEESKQQQPYDLWNDYQRNASMDRDQYGYDLDDDYRAGSDSNSWDDDPDR